MGGLPDYRSESSRREALPIIRQVERLRKVEAEGHWWAKTADGRWLVWDHERADWAPLPHRPAQGSLPPDFESKSLDPSDEGEYRSHAKGAGKTAPIDYTTRRLQIIAGAAGAIAYLEFIHQELDQSLVAAALCLVAAALSFRSLRDDLFVVGGAVVGMFGIAVWYGWSVDRDSEFLFRIAALVGSYLLAFIFRVRFQGLVKRKSAHTEEAPAEEPDTFEEGRPPAGARHYLAAALAGTFLVGTFLSLREYLEPLGVAAIVYLLAYLVGRRPSVGMVIGSAGMGIWFGFSLWFLSSFANPNPPGADRTLGAMLSLAALGYIFLSFVVAIIKDIPHLMKKLARTRQQFLHSSSSEEQTHL